jgi:geranylgeranylglycerol-phosphate geranylgeranyltransferase
LCGRRAPGRRADAADAAALWLAALSITLAILGADAINDAFDVEIDRINRPKRPIPAGAVTARQVVILALALDVLSVLVGMLAGPVVALISLIAILVNILYSWKLKFVPLLGNATIAALFVVPLALGGVALGQWGHLTIPLVMAGFFALGREILMDVRDVEGDRMGGASSLPAVTSRRAALLISAGCFTGATAVALVPGLSGVFTPLYTVLVVVCFLGIVFFMARSWRNLTFRELQAGATGTKWILMLAMIALALAPAG